MARTYDTSLGVLLMSTRVQDWAWEQALLPERKLLLVQLAEPKHGLGGALAGIGSTDWQAALQPSGVCS